MKLLVPPSLGIVAGIPRGLVDNALKARVEHEREKLKEQKTAEADARPVSRQVRRAEERALAKRLGRTR